MPMRWGWFFKLGARHQIGDGARTQFWFDIWAGPRPLRDRFPNLFSICDNPLISVASACNTDLGIRFRRTFSQLASEEWRLLQSLIHDTSLGQGQDKISWGLHPSGEYTVNSMYNKLSQGTSVAHFKDFCAAKLPLKIKIFSWQLALGRLLSSNLIASRHGPASGCCALCNRPESVNHIFFSCSLACFMWSVVRQLLGCSWSPTSFAHFYSILLRFAGRPRRLLWMLFMAQSWTLWLIRNKLTIESKLIIRQPADIIFKTIIFLQLWSSAKPQDKASILELISRLRHTQAEVVASDG